MNLAKSTSAELKIEAASAEVAGAEALADRDAAPSAGAETKQVAAVGAEAVGAEAHANFAAFARKGAEAHVSGGRETGASSRGDAMYELEFPDGRVVRLDADFDDGAVARLLVLTGWASHAGAESVKPRRGRRLVASVERIAAELLRSAEAAGPERFINAEQTAAELIHTAEVLSAELSVAAERTSAEAYFTAEAAGAEKRSSGRFVAAIRRTAEIVSSELVASAERLNEG